MAEQLNLALVYYHTFASAKLVPKRLLVAGPDVWDLLSIANFVYIARSISTKLAHEAERARPRRMSYSIQK